jgi:hypothetical protein
VYVSRSPLSLTLCVCVCERVCVVSHSLTLHASSLTHSLVSL